MDIAEQQKIQDKYIENIRVWRDNPERPRLVREFCRQAGITIKGKLFREDDSPCVISNNAELIVQQSNQLTFFNEPKTRFL